MIFTDSKHREVASAHFISYLTDPSVPYIVQTFYVLIKFVPPFVRKGIGLLTPEKSRLSSWMKILQLREQSLDGLICLFWLEFY